MIEIENIPRIERIKEYIDLIGLDYDFVMYELEKIKENFGVKEGVVVSRVVSGPAFDAGLRRGDVITRIGMTNVSSKTEYENALDDLNNENVIPLRFVRNKNGAFVTIKIKK